MKKVVMFTGAWCNPCKQAKPVFQQIKDANPQMQFEIIDIDEHRDMANDFNITGVPTFMLIENDEEVKRIVGAANVTKVKELL